MPTTLMLRLSCIDYLSDTNELQSMASSTIPANFYRVEDHIHSCFEHDNNAPYDSKAMRYESVVRSTLYNFVMWGTTPSDYARFAREALSSCKGTILDVGCGGLCHTARLYAQSGRNLILLDYSIVMLRLGKARIEKLANPFPANIQMLHADAFHLPFAPSSIDNVVSFGVMHLFKPKQEYVSSLLGVLKLGGRFFFTSLTTDRSLSRLYIKYLEKQQELTDGLSSAEVVALFAGKTTTLHHKTIGSMVFIWGVK